MEAKIHAFSLLMNAAIDQNCEKYIKENDLQKEVEKQIEKLYKDKETPQYQGDLFKERRLGLDAFGCNEVSGVAASRL